MILRGAIMALSYRTSRHTPVRSWSFFVHFFGASCFAQSLESNAVDGGMRSGLARLLPNELASSERRLLRRQATMFRTLFTALLLVFASCLACIASADQGTQGKAAKPQRQVHGPFRVVEFRTDSPEEKLICRRFVQNLNSFPAWPPMLCERKLNSAFTEFSRPEWRT